MRLAVVIAIALAVSARPAHADLTSAVYDDVRDVVEDLIQSEVTTSVVVTIQTRSPGLAFYLRGTLERLGSPYWGSLGKALEHDLDVVVADFVYWHLSSDAATADIVTSAKKFFACVAHPDGSPGCTRLADAVRGQRPLLETECRRAKPPTNRRVACDIGLATLAALEKRNTVRHHVVDALADTVLSEIDDHALSERLHDVLATWLDAPQALPTALVETLGDPDVALDDAAIDKLCGDPATINGFLHDVAGHPGWICFAISHNSLPTALGAKVTINDSLGKLDQHVDYWRIAKSALAIDPDKANDDLAFRLLADLALEPKCPPGTAVTGWPCSGPRFSAGGTITVEWLGHTITGTVDATGTIATKPNHAMMLWLLRFRKAMQRIDELRGLVPPSLASQVFYAGSPPAHARDVLRSLSRMARLASELRARWYLWSQTQELDIAELLRAAREAAGDHAKELDVLDERGAGGAATLDIGDWLRLVTRGDYRQLAMESFRAALDLRFGDQSRPRETFFLTLAAYLLDSGQGVNESVARGAFKAAAKDLLLSATHKGVPRAADRWRFRWLPRLGMRLSFDEHYAIADPGTRRTVVAADWPTAMFAFTDYVGLEASVLDPAAPLAEMALRPAGTYHEQQNVVLDALRPRLGIWVAFPQLSRRLALSTGFAARFLSIDRDTLTYGRKTSLVFDAGLEFVF
ncbi:MAG: hypothetical protein JO257_34640 [Deltaproteobacteria bacterium]|nr:hypothetical protein [Deltaproteobacteria bacterium]